MSWYLRTPPAILLALLLASSVSPSPPPRQEPLPPSDLSLSITWNAYHKVALGTAVVTAGLGLAGLLAILFPLAAYKLCYMLGGCQNTMDYFVDRLVADEGEVGGKVKRSVDYFEPVLVTLAKAYRKYGRVGETAGHEDGDSG